MPDEPRLCWRLILGLALFGPAFGAATIFGWIHGLEGRVLLVVIVVIGGGVALVAKDRPLVHGFLAGGMAGVLGVEMQALFISEYFANNPGYAEIEVPFGWSPRLATAVLGPLNALFLGALAGAVSWMIARLLRLRAASS